MRCAPCAHVVDGGFRTSKWTAAFAQVAAALAERPARALALARAGVCGRRQRDRLGVSAAGCRRRQRGTWRATRAVAQRLSRLPIADEAVSELPASPAAAAIPPETAGARSCQSATDRQPGLQPVRSNNVTAAQWKQQIARFDSDRRPGQARCRLSAGHGSRCLQPTRTSDQT